MIRVRHDSELRAFYIDYTGKTKTEHFTRKIQALTDILQSVRDEIDELASCEDFDNIVTIAKYWRNKYLDIYAENELYETEIGKLLAGKQRPTETSEDYIERAHSLFWQRRIKMNKKINRYISKLKRQKWVEEMERDDLGMNLVD